MQTEPIPQPNWFTRNWKWLLPTTIIAAITIILGFIAAIFMLVFGMMRSSDAYQMAVEQARSAPVVIELLGEPIEEGYFVSGNVNISGSSGQADLAIPLSGPKGDATLYVVASKSAGHWSFQSLAVESKDGKRRIDLLAEQPRPVDEFDSTDFKTFRDGTSEKFDIGESIVIRHQGDQLKLVFTEITKTDHQETATYAYTLTSNGETEQGVVSIAESYTVEMKNGSRHLTPTGGSRGLQHGSIEISWSYHSPNEFFLYFRPGQQLLMSNQ